jgi:dihydropteroate synthase
MGILNITSDSFYDGSKYLNENDMLAHVAKMVNEGASIIDVGAMSTRPGSQELSLKEEKESLYTALQKIREIYPELIISVDTYRAEIAEESVKNFGVNIINDISAGEMDMKMFEKLALLKVPYIMMHMKGTPATMQQNTNYENLMHEMTMYFSKKINKLQQSGCSDIIIDPGFGFSKTLDTNYELLSKLHEFKIFEKPLLVGLSRKSMIYKLLSSTPQEALTGTTVLNTIALQNGAHILRVHDVKEAIETIELYTKLNSANGFY